MTRKLEIEKHYQKIWSAAPILQPFSEGPTHQLPTDFSVVKLPPTELRSDWVYATSCMSEREDPKLIELHLRSKTEDNSIVELLYATAHFHRTGKNLDVGHTVNFGRPWIDESNCEYGLISLPYVDGPELEVLRLRDQVIHFYWIVPVYKTEVEFKISHGLEALEKKFDEASLSYADPNREAVI